MRKLIVLIFTLIISSCAIAQVYSKCLYFDKFNDVVKENALKTLVTITDTTVVFETKGFNPETYYIFGKNNNGASWDIQNLVDDVYGYEDYYYVVKEKNLKTFNEIGRISAQMGNQDYFIRETDKYVLIIINRTVTTQYSGTWLNSLIIITDPYNNDQLGKGITKQVYYERY